MRVVLGSGDPLPGGITKMLLLRPTFVHRLCSQIIKCSCSNGTTDIGGFPPGSKEVKTTVSSLRIDNIASAGLNISRRLSMNYIAVKHHILAEMLYDMAISGGWRVLLCI